MSSYYSRDELCQIGFKTIGTDVSISKKTSIYSPGKIAIGNHVRIDDFCILSGNIVIGDFVHIAAACLLFGGNEGIVLEDYTGVSSRTAIYAESDNYSGDFFTNPTVPEQFRRVVGGGVTLKKHSIVGSGCTLLPGSILGIGTAVGSMSLVNKTLGDWGIYAGIPCRFIKERSRQLLALETEFLKSRSALISNKSAE